MVKQARPNVIHGHVPLVLIGSDITKQDYHGRSGLFFETRDNVLAGTLAEKQEGEEQGPEYLEPISRAGYVFTEHFTRIWTNEELVKNGNAQLGDLEQRYWRPALAQQSTNGPANYLPFVDLHPYLAGQPAASLLLLQKYLGSVMPLFVVPMGSEVTSVALANFIGDPGFKNRGMRVEKQ